MVKLRKMRNNLNSVEAFACMCLYANCTCRCPCNCDCAGTNLSTSIHNPDTHGLGTSLANEIVNVQYNSENMMYTP